MSTGSDPAAASSAVRFSRVWSTRSSGSNAVVRRSSKNSTEL